MAAQRKCVSAAEADAGRLVGERNKIDNVLVHRRFRLSAQFAGFGNMVVMIRF
jgi:hypothetical protein